MGPSFFTKNAIFSFILGVVLGAPLGYLGIMYFFPASPDSAASPLRQSDLNKNTQYKFIDPLIGLKSQNTVLPSDFKDLKDSLDSFIKNQIDDGHLAAASVIFRDVSLATGFTTNPDIKYSPASLLKVPTMIAYYKLAESDPSILTERLVYSGEQDLNAQEHIRSAVELIPGKSYTVDELIDHSIKYSDNNAATMLIENLNNTNHEDALNSLYRDLGITSIDLSNDFITIQGYSLFFRVLYNATYLSRNMSEKALALLSKTDFTRGIDAGVPNNIIVAGKFGEFTLQSQTGEILKRELHNCGIIYFPSHPYLLCVMTKGTDFSQLESVISGISKQVFDFIEKKYGNN